MSTKQQFAVFTFSGLLICSLFGCTAPDPIRRLAAAHGYDRWGQVDEIRFTFHVQKDQNRVTRAWQWRTRTNQVHMRTVDTGGKQIEVTYNRDDMDDQARRVDAKFINDSYWLLLPMHLMWAPDVAVEETAAAALPIGEGTGRRILVTYDPQGGGYTPGDVYELFVDDRWRIRQWVFRRAGQTQRTLACTWGDYQRVEPLLLSMDRRSGDGRFRLWFSDVSVKRPQDKSPLSGNSQQRQ